MSTAGASSAGIEHLRAEIVRIGRLLEQKSFIESTAGNISCRIDENRALISPAGWRKGDLCTNCLLEIGIEDASCEGTPSSETPLHLGIYRELPGIGAIIHAHPPYATAFAVAGVELQYDVLPEVVVQLGPVPLTPYARPTTPALFESVRGSLGKCNAILLRNHGSITFGKDLQEAYNYLEQLEFFASVLYRALQIGGVTPLPADEFKWLVSVRDNLRPEGA
jgi:L-fuculose-phosphate aldolase